MFSCSHQQANTRYTFSKCLQTYIVSHDPVEKVTKVQGNLQTLLILQLANDCSQQTLSHTALPLCDNAYSSEGSEEGGATEIVFAEVDST